MGFPFNEVDVDNEMEQGLDDQYLPGTGTDTGTGLIARYFVPDHQLISSKLP